MLQNTYLVLFTRKHRLRYSRERVGHPVNFAERLRLKWKKHRQASGDVQTLRDAAATGPPGAVSSHALLHVNHSTTFFSAPLLFCIFVSRKCRFSLKIGNIPGSRSVLSTLGIFCICENPKFFYVVENFIIMIIRRKSRRKYLVI